MSSYTKSGGGAHSSYGSAAINGQLHPVWEAAGVFAAKALGPIVKSNGYPSPATLPASVGGGATGFASSGSPAWSWKLIALLVAVSAVGIFIVHHQTWRP